MLLRRRPRDPVVLLFVFQAVVFTATSSVGYRAAFEMGLHGPVRLLDGLADLASLSLLFFFPDGRIDGWIRRTLFILLLAPVATNLALAQFGCRERHGLSILLHRTEDSVLHGAPCDVLAVRVK